MPAWPLGLVETAWCAAALFAGYAVRGAAGFGSGVVATPLMAFVLPLATPVLAEAEGLTFAVTDPSYFIAFDLAEKSPVTLGEGAPKGCVAEIGAQGDKAGSDAARLGEAFANQLGGAYPVASAKSVAIVCPKS